MSNILPDALQSIVDDIAKCIQAGLYYPALTVALTIPDICVALTRSDDYFVKRPDYVGFIDEYALTVLPEGCSVSAEPYLGVDGLDCYRLRGGVIHRGNAAGHSDFDFTHVIFTIDDITMHAFTLCIPSGNKFLKAAMFRLDVFCDAMVAAAVKWYSLNKDDENVIQNVGRLLSLRPNGMPPFIVGSPVVASGG